MRPAESGNIILETKQDYDWATTASKVGGFKDYHRDETGELVAVDFEEHGVRTTELEGHFIFNPETPETELSAELTEAVIAGLHRMAEARNYPYIREPAQQMLDSILSPALF